MLGTGNMMHMPLLISSILTHAVENNPEQEIVTALDNGELHRYSYLEFAHRVQDLALGLRREGLQPGERVATLAWNTYRHLEIYYATSGIGLICHTVNPRLTREQIAFIINDAQDTVMFYDEHFEEMVSYLRNHCPTVKQWVRMGSEAQGPLADEYESWLGNDTTGFEWPVFDENTASGLCYTSGTTGDPKGALYTHRSTLLHAYASAHPNALCIASADAVMPLVPMFHVNAWGLPYSGLMSGAKLVLPGANLQGERIYSLCERAGVTLSAGVPTIWKTVLDYAKANGKQFSTLGRILIGGSACPPNMIAAWAGYGITVRHAWGMTETSPLGTVCQLLPKHKDLPEAQKQHVLASQGRALFGARLKTVDDEGNTLPRDGKSSGHLLIQGNWIMDRYYGKPDLASENGWFRTGDVGSIDADGYVYITDRSKDVIKSGGEWISSIEIENIAMEEPLVEMAACIAQADDKWGERPVLFVVPREGAELDEAHMLERYQDRVTRWSVPDKVIFIDQMPMTATGKIQKMALRKMLADQADPS